MIRTALYKKGAVRYQTFCLVYVLRVQIAQCMDQLREFFRRAQEETESKAVNVDVYACLRTYPFLLLKEALERQRKRQTLRFGDDLYEKIFTNHLEPLALQVGFYFCVSMSNRVMPKL